MSTFRKAVGCTLALTGLLAGFGMGARVAPQARAAGAPVEVALSNLAPTATRCQTFAKNQDNNGQKLTLKKGGQEVEYGSGLFTMPGENSYACVTFTDIQENGYESFQADVGLNGTVRDKEAQVEFRVLADGKQVYASDTVANSTEAQHVNVDLTRVEVLQLVVDAKGSNANDAAVWGNAHFTKSGATPYLAVDDLEFNRSWQVTEQNILEHVTARDASGKDITDRVKYETNYKNQDSGTYEVTYTVADDSGNSRSRTVKLVVTGEDYTQQLSLQRLKKPWASYLYHGRGTLDTQGKKAWDLILSQLLNFDPQQWKTIDRWGEEVYEVDVDLQAQGIYATRDELGSLASMFMDDEPRACFIKDWGNEVTDQDGLASHVKMWISKQVLRQDEWLGKIETNTQNMLKGYRADMSEAQALYHVSEAYKAWLKYGNGGQLLTDALGNGVAVCGGNARGYIYLSQRLGTKSVWGRSGPHAWSFTKLVDNNAWYKTDLLSGEFLAPGKNGEGNLSVGGNFKSRHYKWFVFGTQEYDRKLLTGSGT